LITFSGNLIGNLIETLEFAPEETKESDEENVG
jgi:hypothetical protein